MEAMLTELPVVTTAIAGIPELVGVDNGVLVAPGDAAELALALEGLANRPDRRLALGRNGRAVVLERHNASDQAAVLRDLLEE
jgi:glycosyltransferase involved in cell wall biosynthesis